MKERPIYRWLHFLFVVGLIQMMFLGITEALRYRQNYLSIKDTRSRVERLETQITTLRSDIQNAQSLEFKDGMVRKYGYVKATEVLQIKKKAKPKAKTTKP